MRFDIAASALSLHVAIPQKRLEFLCGICGVISGDPIDGIEAGVDAMTDKMVHRGPRCLGQAPIVYKWPRDATAVDYRPDD